MPDPMTITTAALASFNHANNLIKSILGVRDGLVNLEQINALQSEIASINTGYLALMQQNFSLLAEIETLKKEIARFKAWDCESIRYKLIEIEYGLIAYALKESEANGEPPHWLCTNCYSKRQKAIYNRIGVPTDRQYIYTCPNCNASIKFERGTIPKYA